MNIISKIKYKLNYYFRRYLLKDPFLNASPRWFADKGDETLRLEYPLNQGSVVFDLGGYHGDFAAEIYKRYRCKVYIFEPVPEFHQKCVDRFKGIDNIICLNYGLSSKNDCLEICVAENASSFSSSHLQGQIQRVHIRSIVDCIQDLGVSDIDLMKINIEGGEYDVLPAMIESGIIQHIKYLQVQFHNFVKHAAKRRKKILVELARSHFEMWNYEFVWESWKLKE